MTLIGPAVPTTFDRDIERLATPIEHPAQELVEPRMAGDVRALLALTDSVEPFARALSSLTFESQAAE